MKDEQRIEALERRQRRLQRGLLLLGLGMGLPFLLAAGQVLNVRGTVQAEHFQIEKNGATQDVETLIGKNATDIDNHQAQAKRAELPVGTIVPSMLDPKQFWAANGDAAVFTPTKSLWAPADGRSVVGSQYGSSLRRRFAPDLRGVFLRGLNVTDGSPRRPPHNDPDTRTVGSAQGHAFQSHSHQYFDIYYTENK
ncbi:MAG: hypothetical protein KDA84_15300, partial [Planctomycetaceae bacterium]|nr:hypothetical protein [Planctomycetaceae bacterium]